MGTKFSTSAPLNIEHSRGHIACPACELSRQATMSENAFALLPFAQAAPIWLESRKRLNPRTVGAYEQYIRALNSFFADLRLTDIHIGHIHEYQIARQRGTVYRNRVAGASIINHECNALSQVLRRAGQWAGIKDWYEPLAIPVSTKARALTPEEEARLWHVASSNPRWMLAYNCAFLTAMTTAGVGELRMLRLRDVDLTRGFIYVREGAKNQYRVREISLNFQALEAAKRLVERAREKGSVSPDHFLLPHRSRTRDMVYNPERPMGRWQTAWESLREKAEMPWLCPHHLRHHAITKMLEDENVSEQAAMDMAGHISNRMLKRYSHIRIEAKRRAADSLIFVPPAADLKIVKK